eukprot:7055278-Pyramimonas_sp.AAC.1
MRAARCASSRMAQRMRRGVQGDSVEPSVTDARRAASAANATPMPRKATSAAEGARSAAERLARHPVDETDNVPFSARGRKPQTYRIR